MAQVSTLCRTFSCDDEKSSPTKMQTDNTARQCDLQEDPQEQPDHYHKDQRMLALWTPLNWYPHF